jgi:hypothetical protein
MAWCCAGVHDVRKRKVVLIANDVVGTQVRPYGGFIASDRSRLSEKTLDIRR